MLVLTLSLQWILHLMDPGIIVPQPFKGMLTQCKGHWVSTTAVSVAQLINV